MTSKRQLRKVIDNLSLEVKRLQEEDVISTYRQKNALDALGQKQAALNRETNARLEAEGMIGVLRKANTELQSQQGRHLVALGHKQAQLDRQAQVFEALDKTQRRLDKEIEARMETHKYVDVLQKANDRQSKRIIALEGTLRSQAKCMLQAVDHLGVPYNSSV